MYGEEGFLQDHLRPARIHIDTYMHGVLQSDHGNLGM